MKINKTFSARINPEVLELLRQLAAKEHRKVNNYISKIIVDHIESKFPDYKRPIEENSKGIEKS